MYADRVEEEGAVKRSVKERLNGKASNNFIPRHQITGKRQRQGDKWEHDLYKEDVPRVPNRKVDAQDLRLKLQRKNLQNASQSERGTLSGGARDLREKLSGTKNTQPINDVPPSLKVKVAQPARKSVVELETPEPEPKRVAKTVTRKKAKQNADTSVEGFLLSLGLEKYAITFQVEEVDMTALVHMNDEDLKALGIPMGPRKKIILELGSTGLYQQL